MSASCFFDPDDVLLYVNPAMDAITAPHYRLEVGQPLRTVLEITCSIRAEDDPDGRKAWIENRLSAHREFGKATVERLKNGRWIRIINKELNDGCTPGPADRCHRPQAARGGTWKARSPENELFRAILDEMPVSSFVKDEQYRYTYVNRAHGELTGISSAEMIGRDDFAIFGRKRSGLARCRCRGDERA